MRGRPRSSFNDVVLRDCQAYRISHPFQGCSGQIALERQVLPCMHLNNDLARVDIVTIIDSWHQGDTKP